MSIAQALAELKLVDKRIRKILGSAGGKSSAYSSSDAPYGFEPAAQEATGGLNWVAVSTKTTPVNVEEQRRTAMAEWASFTDLVTRRDRIKKAVVLSNATTRVAVGSWEGTVAEAIEHKSSIQYKKLLLDSCKKHLNAVKRQQKEAEAEVQSRLDRLLQSELGKDVRTNPETIQSITASFRDNNRVEFVDPLGLADRVKELEEQVEEFETNVDWVLSESNGRTMITI